MTAKREAIVSSLEAALEYVRRGWSPVPVPRGEKGPRLKEWPNLRLSEADLPEHFNGDVNIGLLLGQPSGGLVDIDLDCRQAVLTASIILMPRTAMIHGRGGAPCSHWWYIARPIQGPAQFHDIDGSMLLELRSTGQLTLVPPSLHPEADMLRWEFSGAPAQVDSEALRKNVARVAAATLLARHWPGKGSRHNAALALAGMLLRAEWSEEEIVPLVEAVAKAAKDEELRGRIRDVTYTARRLDADCTATGAPTLARIMGEEVIRRVRDWLELNAGRAAPDWNPQPRAQTRSVNPWLAECLTEFLADDGAEVEPVYEPLLYLETITEIFSPRGLGKSVFATHVAIALAQKGKRVLCIDRDNPRRVIRERLRAWGAHKGLANLKIISREKCPPLTRADLWVQFPYGDFDVVILDSFDSMAEGVGEQDSAKPSRAIAPILDIARRENGPAMLVLGNCVKSAQHSRGSGVVEDRADIVFEVRDATDFHPSGSKPWVEELPAQGASDWVSRSARRKLRQQFRLAFICTKFRLGEEPEPFILEINTVTEPWSLRYVTDEADREGAEARERRTREKADATRVAIEALRVEIVRREQAGEAVILKTQAEGFLTQRGFKRKTAREAIASPFLEIAEPGGKGHPRVVRLAGTNQSLGRNEGVAEPAKTLAENNADFCRPHEQGAAEIDPQKTQCSCEFQKGGTSAADSIFLPSESAETRAWVGPPPKPIACAICGEIQPSAVALARHLDTGCNEH
jgi:Bifunctional DNA primase/polymerase, N-terminal/AAA domain